MNVGQLKQILKEIPDDYWIKTRAGNFNLNDDSNISDLKFMGNVESVNTVDEHKTIVLIRGYE